MLQELGVTLDAAHERAGVYLTNALTGWEPHVNKPLPFAELEEERGKADKVKQEEPILVILGNPPYDGFAGVVEGERERALSTAYRTTTRVRRPEGQGLNDLYVRFFRMAERRIAEKTGQGIVCFITNFEWLDGLSHPGMRERFLDAFDAIRIDCLNGDSRETGKTTPDGFPDPSIFSTEHNREGIRKGTAVSMLVRKQEHSPSTTVGFRHLWGTTKRQQLLGSATTDPAALYASILPALELGLPFKQTAVMIGYFDWPKLPQLLRTYFAGVQTKRDAFLIDLDRETLAKRINFYFDKGATNEEISKRYPGIWSKTQRYDPTETRRRLLARGILTDNIVRHAYRPFDIRWIYWEPETKLLGEKSPDYWPHGWAEI